MCKVLCTKNQCFVYFESLLPTVSTLARELLNFFSKQIEIKSSSNFSLFSNSPFSFIKLLPSKINSSCPPIKLQNTTDKPILDTFFLTTFNLSSVFPVLNGDAFKTRSISAPAFLAFFGA